MSNDPPEERDPSNEGGWYSGGVTLQDDIEHMRRRFAQWMRWYMAMYPSDIPSGAALGRRLGITGSAVTQLLDPKGRRVPSFETLVAAKRLTGFSFDALLLTDPPPFPPRR